MNRSKIDQILKSCTFVPLIFIRFAMAITSSQIKRLWLLCLESTNNTNEKSPDSESGGLGWSGAKQTNISELREFRFIATPLLCGQCYYSLHLLILLFCLVGGWMWRQFGSDACTTDALKCTKTFHSIRNGIGGILWVIEAYLRLFIVHAADCMFSTPWMFFLFILYDSVALSLLINW